MKNLIEDKDMSKFKIEDRVTLKEDSDLNNGDSNNPVGVKGTVIERKDFKSQLPVRVKWDSGVTNAYRDNDLDLVEEKQEGETTMQSDIDLSKLEIGTKLLVQSFDGYRGVVEFKGWDDFYTTSVLPELQNGKRARLLVIEDRELSNPWEVRVLGIMSSKERIAHIEKISREAMQGILDPFTFGTKQVVTLPTVQSPPDLLGWKVKHLFNVPRSEYRCGEDMAVTILFRELGNGYYEYKHAICSKNDMFCRKTGRDVAMKKESRKMYNHEPEYLFSNIIAHIALSEHTSEDFREFSFDY